MEDKVTKIKELEALMQSAGFWSDKAKAQATIKELNELKQEVAGVGKYDKGDGVIWTMNTIVYYCLKLNIYIRLKNFS